MTASSQSSAKESFWQRYFIVYDTLNLSPVYRRLVTRHVELLRPASGDTILDAGAGTGNVTELLAVPGARVVGIDFCGPALVRCREKVPGAEFRQADLTQPLPFGAYETKLAGPTGSSRGSSPSIETLNARV